LGYKARASEAPKQKADAIFDNNTFLPIFSQDITNAKREIIIVSPFVQRGRLIQMLKLMGTAQLNGVKIAVVTRPPKDFSDDAKIKASALITPLSQRYTCCLKIQDSSEIRGD
jgi:phosphatidylserine/phosphatidylglycerophosphate/cardiolipin synthase-like enzyme